MENTEKTPNPETLLEGARNIAASLAVATQSELVSSFVGSAVMDNDFIHLDIDGNNPLQLPLLDATTARWAESGLADTFIIDSRFCDTLELGDLTGNPTRVIDWITSVVDGHTIAVGRFSHTIEEYSLELEEGEYLELPDLRESLRRYINENPVIEDDERDPTGWETLIAFLHQVNFQLKTLDDMCYDGKVSYPELEDWERDDYDPWADEYVVGWGEDVEWRFEGDPDEIAELTDDSALIDPKSSADKIKWVSLSRDMSYPEALDALGGMACQEGSIDRECNMGIVMRYSYIGEITSIVPAVDSPNGDIRSELQNYVSAWQTAYKEGNDSDWFSLSDAFQCLYGQAHLYKAYLLRQRKADIEETPEDERTESEVEELATIPAQIVEQEAEAASYLASYTPSSAE